MRVSALLLLVPFALAQDPLPPPGGFATALREHSPTTTLGPITWVDGVRTAIDVYYPLHPAPATGWPCVLLVHGGAGTRKIQPLRVRGRMLAAAGYVCLAYDVRGEGITTTLNAPGFDASEEARLRDMAEAFARAGSWTPPGVTVDTTRLAVTGESMGGRHSYRAAGWSGQPLPAPIAPYTHMPVIAAVAPRIAPLDVPGDAVPVPILLNAEVATGIYQRGPADPYYAFLAAEDYPPIGAMLAADPIRNYLPRVQASTVPMLITNVWDDAKHTLHSTVEALATLPGTATWRSYWTTNGHSSADNAGEQSANDDSIRRWFDVHMKGGGNGVDLEPRHESGLTPATAAARLDAASHWGHALAAAWPPSGTATTTLFLRSGGPRTLSASPPTAIEPVTTVSNVKLDPTYDVLRFCADDRRPTALTSAIALDNEVFTSQVLTTDVEILGAPRVTCTVDSTTGDFLLTAALYTVGPGGAENLLTAGTHGVRGGVAGAHALTIDLDDTGVFVPAGMRLRLKLRNLPLHDFAGNAFVRWVPCFVPGDVNVRSSPADPASLQLPTRARPHAFVTPRLQTVSAAAGVLADFQVIGGPARAGQFYLLLLGGSGFGPGSSFPPETIPLNVDLWTHAVAAAPTAPFFPGFSGLLDASGRATATIDLRAIPIPPAVLGRRWTTAVLGLDGGGSWGGGPAEFEIWP